MRYLVYAVVHLAEDAFTQKGFSVIIVIRDPPSLIFEGTPECEAPFSPLCGLVKVQNSLLTEAQLDVDLEEHLVAELSLGGLRGLYLDDLGAHKGMHKGQFSSVILLVAVQVGAIKYDEFLGVTLSVFLKID